MVVAGGALGLLRNRATGGWPALPRTVAAALIFILFNVLLASGTRSVLLRLLSRRKVREFLVFFLLLLWMVPRFLVMSGRLPVNRLHGIAGAIQTAGWPWTAAAHIALGASNEPFRMSIAIEWGSINECAATLKRCTQRV